jgi:hypothetical protein
MEKRARLISIVVIAIALMIAFSGVASASWFVELTPENKTFNSPIGYDRTMTGDQGFDFWKSSSENLLDAGNVKLGVATDFNKNFNLYSDTSDPNITKNIGYTSKLGLLPTASSKKMTAYSKLAVTDVQATTRAEVGMTDKPVFNYEIDAGGSNDGSTATGTISAGVSVYAMDGSSRLSYEERSTASGSFVFHKVMDYTSKITTP